MFFIDGEKLDMREDSNPHVRKIKDGIATLKKMKMPITFKFPNYLVQPDPDNEGKVKCPMPFTLQMVDYVDNVEWRWCKSFSFDKDRNIEYKPTSIEVERVMVFNEDELEIAFFMYFISGRCLDGGNKHALKDKWFMLEDLTKEARLEADRNRKNADLSFYIYSEKSPLKKDDIIKLSKAMFIPTIDTNMDVVRNMLYNNINGSDERLNLFYSLMEDTVNLEARYAVQEAFDSGMLTLENNGNIKSVYYKTNDNTRGNKLCDIPPIHSKSHMNYINQYYIDHPDELKVLQQAIVNVKRYKEDEMDDIIAGKPTSKRGQK